ncbi:MAG TPA: IclR family transcriptional regulator [Pseudonocardiaceae bacterium]|nr:IclR family transcriptional regulator [Pseudonocardiaceae bacterium]
MEPSAESGDASRNRSTSVRRALRLLLFVGDHDDPRGVSLKDIATGLDLNKSTALRLFEPLVDFGLVTQDDETGRFRLGARVASLGQSFLSRVDLRAIAHPALRALMTDTGETVHLVIYDHPEVVYVDKVESPNVVHMRSEIGKRMPAYSTATGKAFLAHLPADRVADAIARGLPRRTANTITTEHDLLAELAKIRDNGWAVDNVENEDGVRCVGAPILDHVGSVVAALSVSGPTMRVTEDRVPQLGAQVRTVAEEISHRIGAP